jgi:p-hydroxybenzoate 3-monooxygenase
MRRGPTQTRYYLEVAGADGLDAAEARIRDELCLRLDVPGQLDDVAFVEPTLIDLRMRMLTAMQRGRVFLAGDAAHLITPAGGKGMNLAIQDAVELAHGLAEQLGPRADGERLAAYSATRLPGIWRTQAFSSWMLRLILAGSDRGRSGGAVRAGLRRVGVRPHDPLLARWFAYAYAGSTSTTTRRAERGAARRPRRATVAHGAAGEPAQARRTQGFRPGGRRGPWP